MYVMYKSKIAERNLPMKNFVILYVYVLTRTKKHDIKKHKKHFKKQKKHLKIQNIKYTF